MMNVYVEKKKSDLFENLLGRINDQFGESEQQDYSQYRDDPVGFCKDVLGDTYVTDDCKALMESVTHNKVTHGKAGNAVGKSHSAARVALWFFLTRPLSQVFLAAASPLTNLENILFGSIWSIVDSNPDLFGGFGRKYLRLERSPSSFLCGLTIPSSGTREQRIAKFSGKHASDGVLFVFDEASAVPDECFVGAETCASDSNSRILAIYNPHHRSGEVYRAERDGRANIVKLSALNHIQVRTGRTDITPGAIDRNTTLLRINNMTRPLAGGEHPGNDCFEVPEYLVGCTCEDEKGQILPPLPAGMRKITEPSFATVVLGEYPATSDAQLISQEWIDKARSRWDSYVSQNGEIPPSGTRCVAGLDVAEFGQDSNVLCRRYGNYIEILTTWQGMDVPDTVDRCALELEGKQPRRIVCDETGVGSGSAAGLKRLGLPGVGCKVASAPTEKTELGTFGIMRDQLWWSVREWLRTDHAMLPSDELLLEELLVATYSVDNGKVRIMKKPVMKDLLRRSPDRADSLCLTFYQPELLFPNL